MKELWDWHCDPMSLAMASVWVTLVFKINAFKKKIITT